MKFEQNWHSGFRRGRLKRLTDGRTKRDHNSSSSGELTMADKHQFRKFNVTPCIHLY